MSRSYTFLLSFWLLACTGRGEVLSANPDGSPPPVVLQQTDARLATGQDHACAVRAGQLSCWGRSADGQLGAPLGGDSGPRIVPIGSVRAPAAGSSHSCALDTQGRVYCFGANDRGQLGTGDSAASNPTPVQVMLRAAAVDVRSAFDHSCALLNDASLWCWGYNWEGQLGLGDTHPGNDFPEPVQVGRERDWTFVSTGQGHSCGIRSPGALYCWGRNTSYQIGQGSAEPQQHRSPTRVGVDSDWVEGERRTEQHLRAQTQQHPLLLGQPRQRRARHGRPDAAHHSEPRAQLRRLAPGQYRDVPHLRATSERRNLVRGTQHRRTAHWQQPARRRPQHAADGL